MIRGQGQQPAPCRPCNGSGTVPHPTNTKAAPRRCPYCKGTGKTGLITK